MRHLVTAADERAWTPDRPILFLGEWCRLYGRSHVWRDLDAVVAEPYGLSPVEKARDQTYVECLSEQLLEELIQPLNTFHRTTHGNRYWRILLGHWLRRYVEVTFNRYFTLEQAVRSHAISGTTALDSPGYTLATTDSVSFIWACNDDFWNHVLCTAIVKDSQWRNITTHTVEVPAAPGFRLTAAASAGPKLTPRRVVRMLASGALSLFRRKRDALILSSFLPLKEEIKLQLRLGQCPQLWRSPDLESVEVDSQQRDVFQLDARGHTGYEAFVRKYVSRVIPVCYLEGYTTLVRQTQALPWPKQPKFIFTSNNFDADDIFKAWTATKVDERIPYFTGQHGSNYGTHVYFGNRMWPERVASDAFLTWGWTEGPKEVPSFIFKTAGLKPPKRLPHGRLLLIQLHPEHRFGPQDLYFESGIYQRYQFEFVDALPAAIRDQLTVRLHPAHVGFSWDDEKRWRDRYPELRIEGGAARVDQLIAQSRLVVHSYDSSGILELLSLDSPVMCFWPRGLAHLLPHTKPHYESLQRCGILADSPEQLASWVAERWDDIDGWWASAAVQAARREFCNHYARPDRTPITTLTKLLTSEAAKVASRA